jgi:hypothetical protein
MEFQIEEDTLARRDYLAHKLRAFSREELAPDLEHADQPAHLFYEPKRAIAVRHVERDYYPVFGAYLIGDFIYHLMIMSHASTACLSAFTRGRAFRARYIFDYLHCRLFDYSDEEKMLQAKFMRAETQR